MRLLTTYQHVLIGREGCWINDRLYSIKRRVTLMKLVSEPLECWIDNDITVNEPLAIGGSSDTGMGLSDARGATVLAGGTVTSS